MGTNILHALFIVVGALFAMLLLEARFTIPQVFVSVGVLNAVAWLYVFVRVPDYLVRFSVLVRRRGRDRG